MTKKKFKENYVTKEENSYLYEDYVNAVGECNELEVELDKISTKYEKLSKKYRTLLKKCNELEKK